MAFKKVVRATVFATKRADISGEVFSQRFAKHGGMVGKVMLKYNVISYHQVRAQDYLDTINSVSFWHILIQQHRLAKYDNEFKASIGQETSALFDMIDADGLITVVFPTMEDYCGFLADPAHNEYLNADVAEFARMETVRITLGDEYRVIDDGVLLV
jgi:hypothetical protein